ncbi:MAG TPA: YibE/F family protein [Ruminiclostridium sp.]|nr:YibE/F family protein [Ruminiclostridium sp.]
MPSNHIKKLINKKSLIYLATIIVSVVLLFVGNRYTTNKLNILKNADGVEAQTARVVKIVKTNKTQYNLGGTSPDVGKDIAFTAQLLSGKDKGKKVTALQTIDPFSGESLKEVEPGDKVILYKLDNKDSQYDWVLAEYLRTNILLVLGIIFFVLLLIFGRSKGFNTIVSLAFTFVAIFGVFIPAVLQGFNIYLWSIITCIFIICMTLLIVYGFNKKSLAAGIGCMVGIVVSGILTTVMDKLLKLTGLVSEESMYLVRVNPKHPIDLKAIIFAAILIGAIGAIMDVSMSIAASLAELQEKLEYTPFNLLVKSGISIGKDIMGTMANTLILAYIGSSLSVVLLLVSYNNSLIELLNKEMIVVEILQALVGSIGILFTMPLTSLVCGYLYSERIKSPKPDTSSTSGYDNTDGDDYSDGWK